MKICRICLEEENVDDPIIQRCDCKGCCIHDSCLKKWIKKKGNINCEICKKNFRDVNVIYHTKSNKEILISLFPFYNSLLVIFSTLNILLSVNKGFNEDKVNNSINYSYLMFICSLSDSQYFNNKTRRIKEIDLKINENNLV